MRFSPSKVLNLFTALVLFILLYTIFKQSSQPKNIFSSTCDVSDTYKQNLYKLTYLVHDIMDSLDLRHFLCYGSLFGQIRNAQTLNWEKDAEFCIFNEDLTKYDEVFMKKAFWKRGLDISYDNSEGLYQITVDMSKNQDKAFDPQFNGYVQLIVFAKDKEIKVSHEEMYHRVGWKRRLLPPDCEYSTMLQCFPVRLAEQPLPLKLFGSQSLPVPREEFEILKYHFPDNWWREEKPLNC